MAATPQCAAMPTPKNQSRSTNDGSSGARAPHARRWHRGAARPIGARVAWLALAAVLATGLAVSHPAAGPVNAATSYYVAKTGSDSASGSLSHPWGSVRYAMTRLSAGDTLFVRGGTYNEYISSPKIRAGASGARITVEAYPGEWPVIKGYLWITGATY